MVVLKVRVITVAVHTHTHSGVYPGIEPLCAAQGGAVSDTNYREQRGRGPHSLSPVSLPSLLRSLASPPSQVITHKKHTHLHKNTTLDTRIITVMMILSWISGLVLWSLTISSLHLFSFFFDTHCFLFFLAAVKFFSVTYK